MTDPVAMATLGGLQKPARIEQLFDRGSDHWDEHGFGLWMLFDRPSGEHIGHASLLWSDSHGPREVELGYALLPAAWCGGLATEAARLLVDTAFGMLRLPTLVAATLPTNIGSRRVLERAGFCYERDFVKARWLHVLYRQNAPIPVQRSS